MTMNLNDYQIVSTQVVCELIRAIEKHGDFNSTHEALGVILEEFEELKEEIKAGREKEACKEAIQLAAMCFKLILAAPRLEWK